DSWSFTKKMVVGYGGGVGDYQTSYAINISCGTVLNGRIEADIRLIERHAVGAGLICRADDRWTLLAFYTAPGSGKASSTVARMGFFKEGVFTPLAVFAEPVQLAESYNKYSLEFFSGRARGEIRTQEKVIELFADCPHLPFPGYVGLVKFYSAE